MGTDRNSSLLAACKTVIHQVVPNAEVVLFGSRARGDAHRDSDYDLLILTDQKPSMQMEKALLDRIYPVELQHEAMVSFVVHSKCEWESPLFQAMPLHKNIEREGVRL